MACAIAWKIELTAGRTAATIVKIAATGGRTFGTPVTTADSAIGSKTGGIGGKMDAIGAKICAIDAKIAATGVADVFGGQVVSPFRLQARSTLSTPDGGVSHAPRGK